MTATVAFNRLRDLFRSAYFCDCSGPRKVAATRFTDEPEEPGPFVATADAAASAQSTRLYCADPFTELHLRTMWPEYVKSFRESGRIMTRWSNAFLQHDIVAEDDDDPPHELVCMGVQCNELAERNIYCVSWRDAEGKRFNMPFVMRKIGNSAKPPLFIAMHGGGACPNAKNHQEWLNLLELSIYQPEDGIYLCPRSPTNTWNMWFRPEVFAHLDAIIRSLIIVENVDSNRVYLFGYSAGSDGAFRMVPGLADRLAAGAAISGHPGEAADFTNLCNTPFAVLWGLNDHTCARNVANPKAAKSLQQLALKSPGMRYEMCWSRAFDTDHWMNGEDRIAVPWMASITRNPFPEHVLWRFERFSDHHRKLMPPRFFWLALKVSEPPPNAGDSSSNPPPVVIEGRIEGQLVSVDIHMSEIVAGNHVLVRLNDAMIDLSSPIELRWCVNDGLLHRKLPGLYHRDKNVVRNTLLEYGDPNAVFSVEISLPIKK